LHPSSPLMFIKGESFIVEWFSRWCFPNFHVQRDPLGILLKPNSYLSGPGFWPDGLLYIFSKLLGNASVAPLRTTLSVARLRALAFALARLFWVWTPPLASCVTLGSFLTVKSPNL
jgi:hypothetical protein